MGGTTFDVGIVVDGRPQTAKTSVAARNLLLVPAVEAISIGAGGGSVAWLDSANALHVGPQSQGARPGPACYGRGGTLPTVTDADVVLGYINPDRFLGGGMPLRSGSCARSRSRNISRRRWVFLSRRPRRRSTTSSMRTWPILCAASLSAAASIRAISPSWLLAAAVQRIALASVRIVSRGGLSCRPRRRCFRRLALPNRTSSIFILELLCGHSTPRRTLEDELAQEINAHFDELVALTNAQFEREGIAESSAFLCAASTSGIGNRCTS